MTNYSARQVFKALAGTFIPILALVGTPSATVQAQGVSLEGTWNGAGKIVFPSGESEGARCRVTVKRQGGDNFGLNAVCATASARVQQTADLVRVSGNRFQGEFFNKEYGVSGSIRVTVSGNKLSASMSGGGATAHLALSR